MTGPLHLSRLTLQRDALCVAPILQVLQPEDTAERLTVDHRLIWTVMPRGVRSNADATRSAGVLQSTFLWRAERARGRYFVLGPKPVEASSFFQIETKPFAPDLSPGDRLAFDLRLNATVDRKIGTSASGRAIRQRCDVAMDLLTTEAKQQPAGTIDRARHRSRLAEKAAGDWLHTRAADNGFRLDALALEGYRAERFARRGDKFGTLGIFDLKGTLTVADPEPFLERLRLGFGRGKAFGCGLMLVRRLR